ncbi:MAG: hypothetical protein SFW36_06405 [Leptolyngbyaceae cyanobacterium bins.59]|nr:hypothetical protein [Leptolyngbyaceae cyanobacterium bins.59]
MSAGLKFQIDPQPSRSRRASISYLPGGFSTIGALATNPQEERSAPSEIRVLPQPQPIPLWLRSLLIAQKSASILAVVLGVTTLAAYSQMVFSQKHWNQQYHALLKLQRHERQLVGAIQGLKDQLAREAERPEMGLVYPNPSKTIFLTPAPPRPAPQSGVPSPVEESSSSPYIPLGY